MSRVRGPGSGVGLHRLFRRPEGITESTRWLFCGLAMVSLALSLPPMLSVAAGGVLLMALSATFVLAASCNYVYLTKRVPLGLDLLDAAAIIGLALACPTPKNVVAYVFTAIWFRALYGSTRRSLARCGLSVAAIAATLPLWPLIPGHMAMPAAWDLFGSFPLLFLAVLIARQLGGGLLAREQGVRRDMALATTGSQLLGVTDAAAIRAMAWAASDEICAATPGLRIVKAVRDGPVLRVEGATGGFFTVPGTLPGGVITTRTGPAGARVTNPAPLDAAVDAPIEWACISLTEQEEDAWLLVGAPKKILPAALLSVRGLVNQVALALRNSNVHQELSVQARYDSLTGLGNRASFTAELSTRLAHSASSGLHILFIDLDDFKDINDVLGHRAGDELLIDVAARLRRCTRAQDICARLGGDEFAVVLHGVTDAAAAETAQRIVDSIADPIRRGSRVGASIGIATATPGIAIEELVHQADVAMYAAKAKGKGRVEVFHPGLLQADTPRLSFERQLAAAPAAGELVVHYQPILSLPDLRCTGVEALVRWQHPEHGLLLPEDFIETAERTGAILDIGAFVLRRACADASAWQDAHPGTPLAVNVNVSARELDHDNFIDIVTTCLTEFQMPASQLILELSETVVLNSPAAIDRLTTLAARGVRIAIDDFGTGYSPLTTLRSLPVDVVKLDSTFIAGALTNPVDRTVINAIVQMSTQLGIQTIAEGVERPEEQHFLEEIGTDAVQGYLYGRPIPAPQLATWLENNLKSHAENGGKVITLRPRSTA
jgi:diguanylate cyclase (GGDEF)-like protein